MKETALLQTGINLFFKVGTESPILGTKAAV
jgi:hypothetical protein